MKARSVESFAESMRSLSELSAGTMRAMPATSRPRTRSASFASSDVPKGFVEPEASIGAPLSFIESAGVTRLSAELSIVEMKGRRSVRSVID